MEPNQGTQVLPTLPGTSDLQNGEAKILFLSFRTFASIEEFRKHFLTSWAAQFPRDTRKIVIVDYPASPKPIHEIHEDIRNWMVPPTPSARDPDGAYLMVVLQPFVEARAKLRFGDWHYLVTQTHNHFVIENLDEGDGAPWIINMRTPEHYATDVVTRVRDQPGMTRDRKEQRAKLPVRITVSGYSNTGKTHVLAVIGQALAARWPDKECVLHSETEMVSLQNVQQRLADEESPTIPATHFELREQYG